MTVGVGGGILVEGVLLAPTGEPPAYRTGQLVSLDDPDKPPQPFFTNADGAFTLLDLQPGAHRLELSGRPALSAVLEIPEDAPEVYEAGVIQLRGSTVE